MEIRDFRGGGGPEITFLKKTFVLNIKKSEKCKCIVFY